MAARGVISFRTCYGGIRYPASYVIKLAAQSYNPGEEPSSFQNAFDHWFLIQLLNAIGGHSMA